MAVSPFQPVADATVSPLPAPTASTVSDDALSNLALHEEAVTELWKPAAVHAGGPSLSVIGDGQAGGSPLRMRIGLGLLLGGLTSAAVASSAAVLVRRRAYAAV
jgi:hypothetical protein